MAYSWISCGRYQQGAWGELGDQMTQLHGGHEFARFGIQLILGLPDRKAQRPPFFQVRLWHLEKVELSQPQ